MVHLDTNTLIRFFTNDDPIKAKKVKQLLRDEKEIFVNDVVFPEIEYVLKELYSAKRERLIDAFKLIVSLPNITLSNTVRKAVLLYEKTNLSVADCLIAVSSFGEKLASFDIRLLKAPGVKSYW